MRGLKKFRHNIIFLIIQTIDYYMQKVIENLFYLQMHSPFY